MAQENVFFSPLPTYMAENIVHTTTVFSADISNRQADINGLARCFAHPRNIVPGTHLSTMDEKRYSSMHFVRFQVLTAASMMFRVVFWDE
jgi:hypothetical protein